MLILLGISTRNSLFFTFSSELSIPTLNSILKRDEEKLNLFRTLKVKQIHLEEQAFQRAHLANQKSLPACKPPE
jgi:hypothetical protein